MQAQFWLDGWTNGRTGFHSLNPNPFLLKFFDKLEINNGETMFVPLCGKSVDMLWLSQQGHSVIGVELSPIAAEAFFEEQNLSAEIHLNEQFKVFHSGEIEIYVGDFFNLTPADTSSVRGVYDRAALVALPPTMRNGYAKKMAELLSPGTKILLISFEYDQEEMSGPPHAVSEKEIKEIYQDNFQITSLDKRDILEKAPRFKDAGLSSFEQHVYLLNRL